MSENNFDQMEDMQDSMAEDETKSDTIIEKYEFIYNLYLLFFRSLSKKLF